MDLRFSARSLARTPGLALALLLTIGLGVGDNASVLGFIRGSASLLLTFDTSADIVA